MCVAYLPSHPTMADFEFDLPASILSFSQFKFIAGVHIDVATTRTLTMLTNVNTQVMYFFEKLNTPHIHVIMHDLSYFFVSRLQN